MTRRLSQQLAEQQDKHVGQVNELLKRLQHAAHAPPVAATVAAPAQQAARVRGDHPDERRGEAEEKALNHQQQSRGEGERREVEEMEEEVEVEEEEETREAELYERLIERNERLEEPLHRSRPATPSQATLQRATPQRSSGERGNGERSSGVRGALRPSSHRPTSSQVYATLVPSHAEEPPPFVRNPSCTGTTYRGATAKVAGGRPPQRPAAATGQGVRALSPRCRSSGDAGGGRSSACGTTPWDYPALPSRGGLGRSTELKALTGQLTHLLPGQGPAQQRL